VAKRLETGPEIGPDGAFFYLQEGPMVAPEPLCFVVFPLDTGFWEAYIGAVAKGYPLLYTGFALKQEVEV
jgi:hypothetical protein